MTESPLLRSYQLQGIKQMCDRRHTLLADEPGLGKTAQVIGVINELELRRVLVICPASVKINWVRELNKWLTTQREIQIIKNKVSTVEPWAEIVVVNYDLVIHSNIFNQLKNNQWQLLVCDEAHYLKNMKAERTTAVLGAGALAHKAQRTIMVTGTPVLNRPIELYPMLKVLCPAVIGAYKDYYKYAMRYCNAWYDAFSFNVNGASHTEELNAALRKYYMIRRTLSEVETQIPARQYQMWFIEPSLKVKTKMQLIENAVRKDFQYQNLNLEGGELATVRRETAESKIESCIEHIHDRINECGKLVIFAYHHSVIQNLQKQLSQYNPVVLDGSKSQTQRQAAIDSFVNDPKTQVFIGQIQAAGQGIDGLQHVCNHVMFLEWSWVPGEIEQAMKRVQRMGQTKTTFVEFIVWSDSVEEHMMRTALDKVQVIREVVK